MSLPLHRFMVRLVDLRLDTPNNSLAYLPLPMEIPTVHFLVVGSMLVLGIVTLLGHRSMSVLGMETAVHRLRWGYESAVINAVIVIVEVGYKDILLLCSSRDCIIFRRSRDGGPRTQYRLQRASLLIHVLQVLLHALLQRNIYGTFYFLIKNIRFDKSSFSFNLT